MWNREVALSLVPLAVLNGIIVFSAFIFLILKLTGRVKVEDYRDGRYRSTAVLNGFWRDFWHWLISPIERGLVAARVTPNMITTVGLLFSAAGGVFYYLGHVGTAGYMIIFSGTCDIFDGRVARATGRQSRSGAFYDSVLDRMGESLIFLGLAAYHRASPVLWIVILGLSGSLLVSYIKSRAESLGGKCEMGLMQRPERIFLLSTTSLFDPLAKAWAIEHGYADVHYLVIAALGVIALLTWYTAFQRLFHGFREIEALEEAPVDTGPGAHAEPVPVGEAKFDS